jgi:chlorophyll synthase
MMLMMMLVVVALMISSLLDTASAFTVVTTNVASRSVYNQHRIMHARSEGNSNAASDSGGLWSLAVRRRGTRQRHSLVMSGSNNNKDTEMFFADVVAPSKNDDDKSSSSSSSVNQLLGMKEAKSSKDLPLWKIRLQLMKPVTWVPLAWGVMCGAAASGNYHWIWNPFDATDRDVSAGLHDAGISLLAMILAAPLLTGFTQTINDWYDRDLDAINEPYRPIPSGAISEGQVKAQIAVLLTSGLSLAYFLDTITHPAPHSPTIFYIACLGSFIAYIYSAPPIKLKQNGWAGTYALGASYIALPWWCGQAAFGELDKPIFFILPILYSIAGLGIAIVNDFKSIEGDAKLGLNSLPVAFGIDGAKWICAASVTLTQLAVAVYLASINESKYAIALIGLLLPQVYFQATLLLVDPVKYDVEYQKKAQPFLVLGILATALAVGHHVF